MTVVVDVGSTGTRATAYRWALGPHDAAWPSPVPAPDATASEYPALAGPSGIRADAAQIVVTAVAEALIEAPAARVQVGVWATGGVRTLPPADRDRLVQAVGRALIEAGHREVWVTVLSGEEEARLALHAARSLVARAPDPQLASEAIAVVEVGGASAQIADEGQARSIDGAGLEATLEALSPRPGFEACRQPGFVDATGRTGTGDVEGCTALLRTHVEGLAGAPQQPASAATYVGLAGVYYSAAFLHLLPETTAGELRQAGQELCREPWDDLRRRRAEVPEPYLARHCVAALYIAELLIEGFGIAPQATLLPRQTIDGQPVTWGLGALLERPPR